MIPVYAVYPMAFRELSLFLLKCSAIQMPFFILFMMGSMLLLGHATGLGFIMNLLIGCNMGLVFWGARFFLLVFGFSSGTNDTSTFRACSIVLFFLFVFFGLVYLFVAVISGGFLIAGTSTGMISSLQVILWMGCLLALLDGYVFFRIYGWFYHTGRFDLMRLPQ